MSDLDQIRAELAAFVAEREWSQFHDPKNLAMAIASEAGELSALLRWVESAAADDFAADPQNRAALAGEIADVAIFLLLFADRTGIDLIQAIREKIEVNRANHPVDQTRGHARRVRK